MSRLYLILAVILIKFFLHQTLKRNFEYYKSKKENGDIIQKYYSTHNLKKRQSNEESSNKNKNIDSIRLVDMAVLPNDIILNQTKWNISWITSPTSLSKNSWIGLYQYGVRTEAINCITYIELNARYEGSQDLPSPPVPGVYEIRYIQDNNLKSLVTVGPVYANPSDVDIKISKTEVNPGKKIEWKLEFKENSWNELQSPNNRIYLCLNPVGDYDDCLIESPISKPITEEVITMPKTGGYFVIRILAETDDKSYKAKIKPLIVSKVIKVSSPSFQITPDSFSTVIASSITAKWSAEFSTPYDFVSLFYLSDLKIFTLKFPPIKSKKTMGEKKGNINFFLRPENQAGPYVLVYFYEHRPVAVSDIIKVEQPKVQCPADYKTMSNIKHLVIICTENHSFDSYFGNYCKAKTNSNPKCNYGQFCCEKAPDEVDGSKPFLLNDDQNMLFDPNHEQRVELCQINNGRMDGYIKGCPYSDPQNFAIADTKTVKQLFDWAQEYALADRFFQPNAGASAQNNMYLARAGYVFRDNTNIPVGSVGSNCWYLGHMIPDEFVLHYNPTITSLLAKCGFTLRTYAEGYRYATENFTGNPCYPNGFDPCDIPFDYYAGIRDNPWFITDISDFKKDITEKKLPDVSFVKPLGKNSGHPKFGTITDEINFTKNVVDTILNSSYYNDTLILYLPDESGGYYDHIPPPPANEVDDVPYGPRIPVLAMGNFAKKNYVSHVTMEHSSIIKFIEWNWLSGKTGQLNTRDTNVNGIGDLIDQAMAGIEVP